MAGAIMGAYVGDGMICSRLQKHVEKPQETLALADALFEASQKNVAK